jgi:hypothetical protein
MSSIIAVAAYLKQSPLPGESEPVSNGEDRHDRDDHHADDDHRNRHDNP